MNWASSAYSHLNPNWDFDVRDWGVNDYNVRQAAWVGEKLPHIGFLWGIPQESISCAQKCSRAKESECDYEDYLKQCAAKANVASIP